MSLNLPRSMPSRLTATCLIALGLLASCAAPPPPERPPAPSSELTFDAGVDYAIDDLLVQLRRLPAFSAAPGLLKKESDIPRGVIAVDPAIDGNTGQQTLASKALDSRLLQRASDKFAQFDVAAVNSAILGKAQYLLAATLTPIDAAKASATFRISLSLTDIKTGFVVAQSAARVRSEGVDTTPTPFYRDSPSLTKDRVVEGQIRTAQTPTGSAADEFYMSRLPINALISEGSNRYEAGNYAEALRYYETAAARPEGQQLRVLNGLYLANTQLGRTDDAEKAFAKIVALGLATNSLSVKFLFKPGSLDFLADPKISGAYAMWLRLVAREVAASKACLNIVGHTSHTGNEQFNERLSLQRAVSIQRKIETLAPETAGRLVSVGMGFPENLVGSGTDDLRDALDRRVEFKVRNC
ncbi:MAG: OmpA family protein [Betaproteobacteria bacterium]|nr:MAG: OmpA family protein [Betaproteobacteria bacterium]